ncbi:MAG: YIP1 family protein [Candidatus Aenigmatarchaeota archaeon]
MVGEITWDDLYKKYGGRSVNSRRYEKMSFIEKIKKVILSPTEFFERIKYEEGVMKAFIYFAILSSIVVIFVTLTLNLLISSYSGNLLRLLPSLGELVKLVGIMISIIFYITILIGSFIVAGLAHLFLKLAGGKGDYSMTYKGIVYASTPILLLGWVPFVGIIPTIYSFYLNLKGLSVLHSISMKKVFLVVWVIPLVILGIITLVIFSTTISS